MSQETPEVFNTSGVLGIKIIFIMTVSFCMPFNSHFVMIFLYKFPDTICDNIPVSLKI